MKIGLVCPYDLNRAGGVQEHVLAQAGELKRRGHEVKILTPKPRSHQGVALQDVIFVGNSTQIRTPISTTLEVGVSWDRDALDELLAEEAFDILHIHEPEVPVLGAQIVAKAQCPVVATFHAIHPDSPMAKTIEVFRIPYSRSIFSKLADITAVSDVAAYFVRERTGRKVHIIPNGIDLAKYHPASAAKKSGLKTIVYVGRLEKRKGVKYLLKAYRELVKTRSDVRLVIAGKGPLRESLEEFVEENELPNVVFKGFVEERVKSKLLQSADLFCSPALYGESFGIVLLEAMASGAVTVAGNNPGYSTVLTGVGEVSLIDPKKSKPFAARLGELLDDEKLRTTWRKWAAKEIKQYDYKVIVNAYEKVYKRATRG